MYTGLIHPLDYRVRTFTTGETISLQVAIDTSYTEAEHIQGLAWYHNGSLTRNNGTELVIPNAQSSAAGTYEVKIQSLNFGNPDCDSRLLPQMEFFAMNAPVTFVLTQGTYIHVLSTVTNVNVYVSYLCCSLC